ncbi:VWA domain-containing protein [Gimesia sp.]|uniref:VWA domain-containing protein n=1 Tax=Gimesia sp. TaxID=2024833 RepID=UPI003A9311EA
MHNSFSNESDENSIGWVATTDLFVLSTILIVGLSFGLVRYTSFLSDQLRECKKNSPCPPPIECPPPVVCPPCNEEEVDLLKEEIKKLKLELAKIKKTLSEKETKISQLNFEKQKLQMQLNERDKTISELKKEITELKDDIAELGNTANSIVALRGKLQNVVFLFDSSESMKDSGRFDKSKELLSQWIKNLRMDRFAIIDFDNNISPFRTELVECDEDNRLLAASFIKDNIEADGQTQTQTAIENTFEYYPEVDTIVIFTDGRATDNNGRELTKTEADKIRAWLLEKHPNVVINTVGIGDYIHKTAGDNNSGETMEFGFFLQMLAKKHNGVFIGIADEEK